MEINPIGTQDLEHHINELLNKNYFPRYKYQLSYLAKFSKIVIGKSFAEEVVFHKWVKSDFITITHKIQFAQFCTTH